MNVLDLFSGIGGFSLGLERAGFNTVGFCELNPYCQAVLAKHWPGVKCHTDIRQLDGKEYAGTVDVVCGGYPCQPFSVAGQQRGKDDPRHLWPEMFRIIRSVRPRWIIAENVAGHIKLGFDEVAASLEAEGFTVWPFIIPACAVNAPHRRDRVWIVGYAKHNGSSAPAITGSFVEASHNHAQGAVTSGEFTGTGMPRNSEAMANANGTPGEGNERAQRSHAQPADHIEHGWWDAEPAVGRVANGIPNRSHRLRALGNSIVPQIAEIIGQAIMTYEHAQDTNPETTQERL